MKKSRLKSGIIPMKGLLVIIAVLLIGAAGWALYGNVYNKPLATAQNAPTESPVTTPTQSPSTDATQSISQARSLDIPQLGIKIVNIPDSLSDLNYVINPHGSAPGYTSAAFSTVTLTNLDSNCSASGPAPNGGLTRGEGEYSYNPHIQLLEQFDGFWISYGHPQGVCTTNEQAEVLNVSQTKDTQTLLSNPDNIQLIK